MKLLADKLWKELTDEEKRQLEELEKAEMFRELVQQRTQAILSGQKDERAVLEELQTMLRDLKPIPEQYINSENKAIRDRARQVALLQYGWDKIQTALTRYDD